MGLTPSHQANICSNTHGFTMSLRIKTDFVLSWLIAVSISFTRYLTFPGLVNMFPSSSGPSSICACEKQTIHLLQLNVITMCTMKKNRNTKIASTVTITITSSMKIFRGNLVYLSKGNMYMVSLLKLCLVDYRGNISFTPLNNIVLNITI